ncbi:MAG: hypothetical protein B7C24_10130 [Bacteroidetes bacterium 4572_77]|nr:MAG: hypothetical protein B7C24_10130 [Bacteroidetes bacterium 4572_77]
MTNPSLEFRKNIDAIYAGKIPSKYTRLVPYVPGNTVFEVGAAEGVLSLLLARSKGRVIGIEKTKDRHDEAMRLRQAWKAQGYKVDNCHFFRGDVTKKLDLLENMDTFVAIRTMYYFGDNLNKIFTNVSKRCRHLVLGGNKNRALEYKKGNYKGNIGKDNYYASLDGMIEVAKTYGYAIIKTINEDTGQDPLVIARKPIQKASTLPDYRLKDSLTPYLKKFNLVKEENDILVHSYKEITLSIDEVLRKSWNVIKECHVALMEQYQQNGRSFDYTDTKYWQRLKLNNVDEKRMREKTEGFFDLFDIIKKQGFEMHKKNPVIVANLTGIVSNEFVDKKWRYHRCNGTHRLAIAKVLGIEKIPVLQLIISLYGNGHEHLVRPVF